MKARILIIEDIIEMAELISMYLKKEDMETVICENAEEGFLEYSRNAYDLIVLDINLPGMDGYEFLQKLRKESTGPVMVVSARDTDEDMIMGLGIGADDFVTKPFSPKVLTARVRAMLRRTKSMAQPRKNLVTFGDFILDPESYILKRGEERVVLSARELEVLAYLAKNAGKPVTPETIYNDVWNNEYGDITIIAVYIQRLRKKIEDDPGNPTFIETVRGKGYRFSADALHGLVKNETTG